MATDTMFGLRCSPVLMLALCLCWVPCCRAQSEYEVVPLRRVENTVTLSCRDQNSLDISNAFFYLNGTQQNADETNEWRFVISRQLEGLYTCGPPSIVSSTGLQLVAHPLPTERVLPKRMIAVAGRDATLSSLIPPGALIQQYFIDWQNAATMATLVHIQGPRSQLSLIEQSERYSVDPDTFDLTIQSVTFEDRGHYKGVIGVMEPTTGGQLFIYEQTQMKNITLEVYVPPNFQTSLPEHQVVSLVDESATTFTCVVEGFPQPTIQWYHGSSEVSNNQKYWIQSRSSSTEAPFIIESTLRIMDLTSHDSGNVTCVAMVTTPEGVSHVDQTTSQLSVLGDLLRVTPFVTTSRGVILRVNLARPLATEVQLFIQYTNTRSGEKESQITPNRYADAKEITFIDETAPYEKFTVEVALVVGPLMGPLKSGSQTYDLSQPSELNPILMNTILPWCGGLLALLIFGTIVITGLCICFCHKQCTKCCFRCNSDSTKATIIDDDMGLKNMKESLAPTSHQPSGAAGGPVFPGTHSTGAQTDSSKPRRWLPSLKILCYETKREKEAKETYREIKKLLKDARVVEMTDMGGTSVNGANRVDNTGYGVIPTETVDGHYEEMPAVGTGTLDSRSTARSSDVRGLISSV